MLKHSFPYFIILIFILISCNKEEEIPSYIGINDFNLTSNSSFGENTENITDVWIYIDENLQGVYEIPVTFPVLNKGLQNIRIKAGVKANGIASTRIQYPFYTSYLDTVELVMAFEEEFGSEISDSEAEKILTVGDAVKFIESKAN